MIELVPSKFDLLAFLHRELSRFSPFFVLIVFFACSLLSFMASRKIGRARAWPPGPTPLPVIGNAHNIMAGPHKTLEYLQIVWPKQYGDIYSLKLGPFRSINISSPELIEIIVKSSKLLDKGPIYRLFHPWIGNGLIVGSGYHWRVTRRMLTPAFHFQILGEFFAVFVKQAKILCDLIGKQVDGHGNFVTINKLLGNCALDSLCEATMGVQVNAQTESSDYVKCISRMTDIVIQRFSKPWLTFDWIFSWSKLYAEQSRLLGYMHSYADKVIKERWEVRQNGSFVSPDKKNRPALLDTLLDNYPLIDDSGKELEENKRAIQQEVNTFLFAGHDTTAAAMTWFIYCMARNPDKQEKVWQELKYVYDDGGECTEEELSKFTYFDCCLKESMRLYTTAPHIERHLTEDVQLGDYLLPAGTDVTMLLYRLHHHERYYPDPFNFKPERFLDGGESKHPYVYIPFSAGPRNCIGQRFAMMELRVVLTIMMRRFEFYWDDSLEKPVPSFQAVLKPLHDFKVGIRLRHLSV